MNCSEFDALSRTSPVFAIGLWGMGTNACGLLSQLRSHCAQPVLLRRDHMRTGGAPPTDVIYQTLGPDLHDHATLGTGLATNVIS
jgi:hypothetical protein